MTPYPPTGRFAGRLFFAEPGDPPAVGDIVFRPQSFDVPEGAPYTVIAFVIRETRRKFQHTLSQLTIWERR